MADYPHGFVGPVKPGDTYSPVVSTPIYVDIDDIDSSSGTPTIKPGSQTYGSVDEYQSSGGGSGAASRRRAREAATRRAADAKRIADAKLKAQQEAARKEQQRIADLRRRLMAAGARKSEIAVMNAQGEVVRTQTIIQGSGQKVIISTNRVTGATDVKTYKQGRLSGGLSSSQQSNSDVKAIVKDLKDADLKPVKNAKGQVVGFRSGATNKRYAYTAKGIKDYESDMGKIASMGPRQLITYTPKEMKNPWTNMVTARKEIKSDIDALKIKLDKLEKAGKRGEAARLAATTGITLQLDYLLTSASETVWEAIYSLPAIVGVVGTIAKDPRQIVPIGKQVGQGLIDYTLETLTLIKVDPIRAIGRIGADFFMMKGVSKGLKVTGKVSARAALRLNPYFKSFNTGVIKIKVPSSTFIRRGKTIYLTKRVGKWRTPMDIVLKRKRGQFKKFQSKPGIELKLGTIGKGTTLAEQAKLAGTKGTITTAQANKLVGFFRRNNLIRKPIPNEANFTAITKRLLEKFDEGKLSSKDFKVLNSRVLKESGKSMLETSTFANPHGVVRFTRIGAGAGEASLRDILTGNVSFKKMKPQIIVFPEGQIAKFPKSLQSIVRKLKKGKKLTAREQTKLVEWQVGKKDGKWKPVGDTNYKGGVELEVTISPGQTIRRVKKLGVTEINGVKVPIVQAKIIKLTPTTVRLLNKAKLGKILATEIKKLKAALRRETRLPVSTRDIKNMGKYIRRRSGSPKPYYPVGRRVGARSLARGGRAVKRGKKPISRKKPTSKKKPGRPKAPKARKPSVRKPVPRKKPGRPKSPRKPTPRPPRPKPGRPKSPRAKPPRKPTPRPPRVPPKYPGKPIIPARLKFKQKRLSKAVPTYYVVEKVRGKMKKLYPKPLRMTDARDYAAYQIDHRLSRTAFFVPLGKHKIVVSPPKSIKGYYSKISRKLRPYKIRYGSKKLLVNGYIEKRKYFQDTKTERLQAARLRAKSRKKKVVKRRTPVKRKRVVKRKPVRRKPVKRKKPVKRRRKR